MILGHIPQCVVDIHPLVLDQQVGTSHAIQGHARRAGPIPTPSHKAAQPIRKRHLLTLLLHRHQARTNDRNHFPTMGRTQQTIRKI